MTLLVKHIRVVTDYLVVGEANSRSSDYWDRDFKERRRVTVKEHVPQEIEALREPTVMEAALISHIKEVEYDH